MRSLPVFSLERAGRELLVEHLNSLHHPSAFLLCCDEVSAVGVRHQACQASLLSRLHSETDAESVRISGKMNIIDFEKVVSAGLSLRIFSFSLYIECGFTRPTFPLLAELYLSRLESQSEPLRGVKVKKLRVDKLTAFLKSMIKSGRGRCHCQAYFTTELVQCPIVRYGSSCRSTIPGSGKSVL